MRGFVGRKADIPDEVGPGNTVSGGDYGISRTICEDHQTYRCKGERLVGKLRRCRMLADGDQVGKATAYQSTHCRQCIVSQHGRRLVSVVGKQLGDISSVVRCSAEVTISHVGIRGVGYYTHVSFHFATRARIIGARALATDHSPRQALARCSQRFEPRSWLPLLPLSRQPKQRVI